MRLYRNRNKSVEKSPVIPLRVALIIILARGGTAAASGLGVGS
jgi:hypothetical protein